MTCGKMAVNGARTSVCMLKFASNCCGASGARRLSWLPRRLMSSSNKDSLKNPTIVVSQETIVCWHPEPTVPYEHTKPLPRNQAEIQEGDSVLKVQYLLSEKYKHKPEGPDMQELADMFHTAKPEFRHRPRKRFAKKTKPDREGL